MEKLKKARKRRRTNVELTETLMGALSSMMSNQKFRQIGINDLTAFATVEKNFIYKHYEDMDSLLREYVKRNDYWGKLALPNDTYNQLSMNQILHLLMHALYQNFTGSIDFQNIIRWEIALDSDYVKENAQQREAEGLSLIKYVEFYFQNHPGKDVACLFSLLSAGVYYLILHKDTSTFGGIDFSDQTQSNRLLAVMDQIIDLYLEEDKNYELVGTKEAYGGDLLMYSGIVMPVFIGDLKLLNKFKLDLAKKKKCFGININFYNEGSD